MSTTINIASFKGGVGKTTTTAMLSYVLAELLGKKVLQVDSDPQGNLTDVMLKTYDKEDKDVKKTIYEACKEGDLKSGITELSNNLHICASAIDFVGFTDLLYSYYGNDSHKRANYLNYLLSEVKDEYDYVLIDSPPTISEYTHNAIMASDYVLIVMQTHERALSAAEAIMPYLQSMIDRYGADIQLIGVLPVLTTKRATTDQYILKSAEEIFDDFLFEKKIQIRERFKRFDITGITHTDHHDVDVINLYKEATFELVDRIGKLERTVSS